jgi:hypothetical protein
VIPVVGYVLIQRKSGWRNRIDVRKTGGYIVQAAKQGGKSVSV